MSRKNSRPADRPHDFTSLTCGDCVCWREQVGKHKDDARYGECRLGPPTGGIGKPTPYGPLMLPIITKSDEPACYQMPAVRPKEQKPQADQGD